MAKTRKKPKKAKKVKKKMPTMTALERKAYAIVKNQKGGGMSDVDIVYKELLRQEKKKKVRKSRSKKWSLK